jgi:hypothetical protein
MKQTVLRVDEQVQAAMSKEGRYLTFAFLEKGPNKKLELQVVGWTRLELPSSKSENIKCTTCLDGEEIPLVYPRILLSRGTAAITDTACIIIFEHCEPQKYYSAIVVDAVSNVMNIAEKDPETVAIVETHVADEHGGNQVQYNIIETSVSVDGNHPTPR